MNCPKCNGAMRSFERNGVTVEQCADCRGIFLDRGELDHLIDAEKSHGQPVYAGDRNHHDGYRYEKKKHHGFFGELFDD
jgi:uncharacterized protein